MEPQKEALVPFYLSLLSLLSLSLSLALCRWMRLISNLRQACRVMSTSATIIRLDPTETSFVKYLDDFAQQHDPPVECRIAGGWVRDKVS